MRNSTPRAGAQAPGAPTLTDCDTGQDERHALVDAARLRRRLGDHGLQDLPVDRVGRGDVPRERRRRDGVLRHERHRWHDVLLPRERRQRRRRLRAVERAVCDADSADAAGRAGHLSRRVVQRGHSRVEPPASNGAPITAYNVYRGTVSGNETLLAPTATNYSNYTDSTAVRRHDLLLRDRRRQFGGRGRALERGLGDAAHADPTGCADARRAVGRDRPGDAHVEHAAVERRQRGSRRTRSTAGRRAARKRSSRRRSITTYFDKSGGAGHDVLLRGDRDERRRARATARTRCTRPRSSAVFRPYDAMPLGS